MWPRDVGKKLQNVLPEVGIEPATSRMVRRLRPLGHAFPRKVCVRVFWRALDQIQKTNAVEVLEMSRAVE